MCTINDSVQKEELVNSPNMNECRKAIWEKGDRSPYKLLAITTVSVFVTESVMMILLYLWPIQSPMLLILVNAFLLTLFVIPALYLFLFRPLIRNISQRKKAQENMQIAYDTLEDRVRERTQELLASNEALRAEIEERERMDEELKNERQRLFSVLEKLPASVHLIAQDYSIPFANKYFRERFGDPENKHCYEILHCRKAPCEICRSFEVFNADQIGEREELRSNGYYFQLYNYPFTDIDGSKLVLQLGIDVTQRHKIEQKLRKSEQRFRILVNSMNDIVFTIDKEQRIGEIYGNLEEKIGRPAQYYIGKTFLEIYGPERSDIHQQALDRVHMGETSIYEWQSELPVGVKHFQNSLSPLFNADGQIEGMVGVARDISTQKLLERQIIQTEKLMAVAQMSAMISHEFRNSLTSVRMILELQLESSNLIESEVKSLSVALSSITHMEKIVSQLLAFSRPTTIVLKPENLNRVIEETIAFVKVNLTKNRINLVKSLDPDLPSLNLDALHLKEALMNVILNATKAIAEKEEAKKSREIRIRTEKYILKDTLRDDNIILTEDQQVQDLSGKRQNELVLSKGIPCALIEIKDTGLGIHPDHLIQIFDPFFTTMSGGTGLGLPMVKRTVNAHNGIITADSKVGRGTTIKIYLPISKLLPDDEKD